MSACPCRVLDATSKSYEDCCAPLHLGKSQASTPEQLMRARYSAYVKKTIPFIAETQLTEVAEEFDQKEAEKWAESADWKGLKILSTKKGGPADNDGIVEFEAHYTDKASGKDLIHKETSLFHKVSGKWLFKEGVIAGAQAFKRLEPKIGRNDPCSCGSGKKFKKCCGA
ncbi:MAG: SEC-C domain-containing protein [Bacteriovoracaceae bacterium]|nr:SEC-C domain-containing protein [Bacteriovoracaceae bacterium]